MTVLIGLSLNGVSRLGVVHNPFTDEDPSLGRTLFGTIEHGLFSLPYDPSASSTPRTIHYLEPFDHLTAPPDDHKFTVAASLTHFSDSMRDILSALHPADIQRLGGAGNKCANLALGKVDAYLHPSMGLKYWDLCAPEILIKAMGGYATNIKEERLTYWNLSGGSRELKGLMVGRNPQYNRLVVKRLGMIL